MKILLAYLRPYRRMVFFVLFLAAINIGFSLVDPIIFGKLINLANEHQSAQNHVGPFSKHDFLFVHKTITVKPLTSAKEDLQLTLYGVVWLLLASISVAMISRIAKNFQDYFLSVIVQKFGA